MRSLTKLTWVELKLFVREPLSIIFTFAFPLVLLVVLIASFTPNDPAFGGLRPSDYYLASYIAVVIGAIGLIVVPVRIAGYREGGVLRRLRASSVPGWSVFASQAAVGLGMAVVGAILLGAVGRLAYGAALPASLISVTAAFLIGAFSFLALGLLLALIAPNARAAQGLGLLLFLPLWLLSGAGPPPDVMGAGMRHVSEALPLTYVVRALQDPWVGSGANVAALLVLIAVAAVATAVTLWLERRAG